MNLSNNVIPKGDKCPYCLSTYYTEKCPNLPCRQNKYNSPDSNKMKTLQPQHFEFNQYSQEIQEL